MVGGGRGSPRIPSIPYKRLHCGNQDVIDVNAFSCFSFKQSFHKMEFDAHSTCATNNRSGNTGSIR